MCIDVCPVKVPDAFNAGLSERTAVYRPVPHAAPLPYLIDPAAWHPMRGMLSARARRAPSGSVTANGNPALFWWSTDERIVRDSLKEILAEEGYSVETAGSGPDALARLAQTEFHLMLADIKMPGMDGIELLEKATAVRPELDVVMMTAYATVDTAVEAMKIGALDYLIKPFDTTALVHMINGIHGEKEIHRGPKLRVGAIVLAAGAAYFNPFESRNPFG